MKRNVLAVVVSLLLGAVVFAQSDPRIGRWKANIAKSTFDPGPPVKSDMRTYEATADGTKGTVEQTPATGSPTTLTYTAKYDGKDYPLTGSPTFDTIALKRIDAHTTEATLKKAGQVVATSKTVVSSDGKTMTNTLNGIDANGGKVHNTIVFDKQP
jgi:hypothetical protein